MSKFNKHTATSTTNFAGGEAYKLTPENELVSLVLGSFMDDTYYESGSERLQRLQQLTTINDKQFVAQTAVYARREFGMRSVSHAIAAEMGDHASGKSWAKSFFDKVVRRPDDMTEIVSYWFASRRTNKLPNAMKRGLAKAFDKFDGYQLAKYRATDKAVKLIDLVNLVHPVPSQRNADALTSLVNDTLRNTDTWESRLSDAGQEATDETEKQALKANAWSDLISSRRIGYFALLRNLRNILNQAPEAIDAALEMLTDKQLIKKSLVLPFRFVTAYEQIASESHEQASKVLQAINCAIDIACSNVPKFDGQTLVVADFSLSMGEGTDSLRGKASMLGAILAKSNNADMMIFGDEAAYVPFNANDTTISIVNHLLQQNRNTGIQVGHGTNFHAIFESAEKGYNRIIILSDMQGWIGDDTPMQILSLYEQCANIRPFIFSVDLSGYGTSQFVSQRVFALSGWSEKLFDFMQLVEKDPNALVNAIKSVEL